MTNNDEVAQHEVNPEKPICGIVMPISATVNHSPDHWRQVRILIERAIERAGFKPVPVWESVATERITKRIIGNIFAFPVIVADISDLNPNVMLELGLRLASKKPTLVIRNEGGKIPFDIHDLDAPEYPASLTILDMEVFVQNLSTSISQKHQDYINGKYSPFLEEVVIDVISPTERPVTAERLILERLDQLESAITQSRTTPSAEGRISGYGTSKLAKALIQDGKSYFFADFTDSDINNIPAYRDDLSKVIDFEITVHNLYEKDSNYWAFIIHDVLKGLVFKNAIEAFSDMCAKYKAKVGIPREVAYRHLSLK